MKYASGDPVVVSHSGWDSEIWLAIRSKIQC